MAQKQQAAASGKKSKLEESRARAESAAHEKLAKAQAGEKAANDSLKEIEKKLNGVINALRKENAALRKQAAKAQQSAAKAKPQADVAAQAKKDLKAIQAHVPKFTVKGNLIEILKKSSTPKYPDSIFKIDELEPDELEAGAGVDDIKAYIKENHGKGEYSLRAWDTSKGFRQPSGKISLTI